MKILYCKGRVSNGKHTFLLRLVFFLILKPGFLVAQYKHEDKEYPKKEINAFIKGQLALMVQKKESYQKDSQSLQSHNNSVKKVWRPVVGTSVNSVANPIIQATPVQFQADTFIGKVPGNWIQLCQLLKEGPTVPGLELPRIIALSGPSNCGKSLLVKKMAKDLSFNYLSCNLTLLLFQANPVQTLHEECIKAIAASRDKKLILHLERFNDFCGNFPTKIISTIVASLEHVVNISSSQLIFLLESQERLMPEVRGQLKSIVETVEIYPADISTNKELWRYFLSGLQLPVAGLDDIAVRFKGLNPQDIHQITQRVARRCLVAKDRTYSPFSLNKLIQEAEKYMEQSVQPEISYIQ